MTHSRPVVLCSLVLGACCFDGLGGAPPVTPLPPPSLPGTGTGPLLPGGPSTGIGTPIAFGPGSVDPTFAQGFGGGPLAGTSLDPSCYAGHYSVAPSHILTLDAPLPYVRVMAYSARGTDLTLLVRSPTGIVTCNDDSDGLNPTVELIGAMPGEYQVYVGNFSMPSPEPYDLGVSTSSTVTSSSMHFAPSSVVPNVASAPLTSGLPERSGTASVTSISGSIPGVGIGTSCAFVQTRVLATGGPGVVDCRWAVTCGGVDLYGGSGPGGYQSCREASWSVGTLAMDIHTTGTDTDPTFLFGGSSITIGDDASGAHGAFTVTLLVDTSSPPLPTSP